MWYHDAVLFQGIFHDARVDGVLLLLLLSLFGAWDCRLVGELCSLTGSIFFILLKPRENAPAVDSCLLAIIGSFPWL